MKLGMDELLTVPCNVAVFRPDTPRMDQGRERVGRRDVPSSTFSLLQTERLQQQTKCVSFV